MGTLKVDTIQDSGGNTILSSDGSGGFSNSLPAGKTSSFRNIIINGDMSIAQRGTSSSSVSGSGYYTVDRFRYSAGSGIVNTFSQSTDVPSGQGFKYSFKQEATTGDASLGADEYNIISHRMEGNMFQSVKYGTSNAESLTASFWIKASVTGTYICELYNNDAGRSQSQSYTISSANTWEKKTITFSGDTSGSISIDNGRGLDLNWWLGAGTTFSSGTLQTTWNTDTSANRGVGCTNAFASNNDTVFITGVQLEVGTTASDFEFVPYDVNLQRCARYYTQINQNGANPFATFSGRVNGTADVENIGIPLPTFLRTGNPTVTKSGSCIAQAWDDTGYHATSAGGGTFSVFSDTGNNTPYLTCKCNGFSGLTGGAANISFVLGTPSIEVDAEL